MRRARWTILAVVLVVAGGAAAASDYGSGVTLAQATPISDIFARPDAWSGRTVRVEGKVVDVCSHRGCWMDLAGDRPDQTIRVKVEDGVIVFPVSARGRKAAVQGVVETLPLCPEEEPLFRQKEARAKGVPFDPASVTGKESALAIRATGAVIE